MFFFEQIYSNPSTPFPYTMQCKSVILDIMIKNHNTVHSSMFLFNSNIYIHVKTFAVCYSQCVDCHDPQLAQGK